MDAGSFIQIPRDPGQNIYFKVFYRQVIFFKKLTAPPPQSTVRHLTKKGPLSTFPQYYRLHHTNHIAIPNGLWPSNFAME